jgi:predicted metal-dependent peptidase
MRRLDDEVARAVLALLAREPFFAHVLGGIGRRYGDPTPTAAVGIAGGRPILIVNPDFFLRELGGSAERVAVLKHEVLHLVLRHLFRRDDREPRRWNVACDLVVNQLVGSPWKLPAGAITLSSFPELALPKGASAERYYDLLARAASLPEPHDDHTQWSSEPPSSGARIAAEATLDRVLCAAADRVGAAGFGDLPGSIAEALALVRGRLRPKLDWRSLLRLFASSSRCTRIRHTMRQPSKRFGTLPGIVVHRMARLAVAVDTSGSMSAGDLERVFAELHGIWRQGAEITVLEADAEVQKAYVYRGAPPPAVHGRGGTSFEPVMRWLDERRRLRWDGLIYLTDGYAPAPSTRPPCPILWVLTPAGSDERLPFGRALRLSEA